MRPMIALTLVLTAACASAQETSPAQVIYYGDEQGFQSPSGYSDRYSGGVTVGSSYSDASESSERSSVDGDVSIMAGQTALGGYDVNDASVMKVRHDTAKAMIQNTRR